MGDLLNNVIKELRLAYVLAAEVNEMECQVYDYRTVSKGGKGHKNNSQSTP